MTARLGEFDAGDAEIARNAALAIAVRREEDPLYFYRPHPKQRVAHEQTAHIELVLGGNGSAKTYFGVNEFAAALTGRHWVNGKYPIPPLAARICAEKQALTKDDNAIIPMLRRLLGGQLEKGYPRKDGTPIECNWRLKNGSHFDIMVYEQDDKAFESVSKDLIWFDEPFRESIWKASVARMRRGTGGTIIITMTPLIHAAWMYYRFIDQNNPLYDKDDRPSLVYMETWDNCKCLTPDEHDGKAQYPLDVDGHCRCHKGYVHRQAIERQIKEYDEEEKESRITGKFIMLSDVAFKTFNPDVHVVEPVTPEEAAERKMQLYVAIDPHQRRPPFWALFGVDEFDHVTILDEYPNFFRGDYKGVFYERIKDYKAGYDVLVPLLLELEDAWGLPIMRRFIDPRFGSHKLQNTNRLVMEELAYEARLLGRDMRFIKALTGRDEGENEIASGIALIRKYLSYDPKQEIGIANTPMLFVSRNCANFIRMFQYLKHETIVGRQAETKLASNKLEEKFKDPSDVLRYFLKSFPGQYIRPRVERVRHIYQPTVDELTGY
jgi:phage terminase large subunit-like protein